MMASHRRRTHAAAAPHLPRWLQTLFAAAAGFVSVAAVLGIVWGAVAAFSARAVEDSAYTSAAARVAPLEARVGRIESEMATRETALTARLDTARAVNQQTVSNLTNRVTQVEAAQAASATQDAQTAAVLERLSVQVAELRDRVQELTRGLFGRMQRGTWEPDLTPAELPRPAIWP
jgi:multidrug resistance efflux pump